MQIRIVDDEQCPECGAMWFALKSENPLNSPNQPKVGDENGKWWWKCYNPACKVSYYLPETGAVEY